MEALKSLWLRQIAGNLFDGWFNQSSVSQVKMDKVRVILDECYDTIQILCIIGTQAIETSGLFLQNLIPSNVQVNQRSVLPNDLKELGEDDGPQTLPTYVYFF